MCSLIVNTSIDLNHQLLAMGSLPWLPLAEAAAFLAYVPHDDETQAIMIHF